MTQIRLLPRILALSCLLLLAGCRSFTKNQIVANEGDIPLYFKLCDSLVITSSPGGITDTLTLHGPLRRLICMSSSHVAFLDALGCDSLVVGVSGIGYLSSPLLHRRYDDGEVFDVGYEAAPDYERILSLRPDLVTTYTVSSAVPPYITKLKSLGINVLVLNEHLEQSPLARASYIRLFGALTDRLPQADSLFGEVSSRYYALKDSVEKVAAAPVKVLLNIPYADQWYIPGGENYMSQLLRDAGGTVLGAKKGEASSSVISQERAWQLGAEADYWLNTGWCRSLDQLRGQVPLLAASPVLSSGRVYNNTSRTTPSGGNDFWETGAARPDLILRDLSRILSGRSDSLFFYIPLR